jgi:hypothetical protein
MGVESQSFLFQGFLGYLHEKIFSRFFDSSSGPKECRKIHLGHKDSELLRKFHVDVL